MLSVPGDLGVSEPFNNISDDGVPRWDPVMVSSVSSVSCFEPYLTRWPKLDSPNINYGIIQIMMKQETHNILCFSSSNHSLHVIHFSW